jgi:hypothetical protein
MRSQESNDLTSPIEIPSTQVLSAIGDLKFGKESRKKELDAMKKRNEITQA